MNKTLILVVEDDTPVHNLITTTLKTHDYKYISAKNGAGAIMEASTHNPDIVLLDLGLPDIDGVEVIEKIRSWSNMPIIVISARSEDSDKIEALDAGADDYLTKPFSVEELLARLRVTQRRLSQMQAENGVQSAVFENGALRIEYAAGCAYLPAVAECREGADAYVYYTENLGKQLGERYRFPPCFHGDASEKAGKERRADAVYPDAYRGWLPDAEGRVKEEKI